MGAEARAKLEMEGEEGDESDEVSVTVEEEKTVEVSASTTLSSVSSSSGTASGDEAARRSETSSISGEMAEISTDEDREELTADMPIPEAIHNVDILGAWRDMGLL